MSEGRGSRLRVYLNGVRAVFHRPHPRKGAVKSLRRFLLEAGLKLEEYMLEYKRYRGRFEFDEGANVLHGEVVDTRDVITFEGLGVDELTEAFHDSVDDYLEYCAARGEKPEKPFSSRLMLRLSAQLHRRLHLAATREEKSLDQLIKEKLGRSV